MTVPTAARRCRLSAQIRISAHSEGVVILDIHGGHMFATNAVGGRILALLGEDKSPEEIIDLIGAEFDAPLERVEVDFRNFIESLRARDLLQP